MSTDGMAETGEHGMPQAAGSSRADAGLLAQIGALASAIVASACCWLPLLLIAVGVSGGALSATFEAWRPVLLPVTFALLGLAFYFTYRKPRATTQPAGGDACCAVPATESKGEPCCPPARGRVSTLKKLNKVMLWVVTAFVLAFAFFPNYVGYLLGGGDTLAVRSDLDKVVVNIEGMTCEACAAGLQAKLAKIPGVSNASVSYEQGQAVVTADPSVVTGTLREAVSEAGYTVTSATRDGQALRSGEER